MSGFDFNLNFATSDGFGLIPSVCETFIPSHDLAMKVEVLEYYEDVTDGQLNRGLALNILEES